jgi:uncharacterized protein (DUF1800 family)
MSRPPPKWSTAYNRFGFGARGHDSPPYGDAREALESELAAPDAGALLKPDLPTAAQAMATFYEYNDRPKPAPTPSPAASPSPTATPGGIAIVSPPQPSPNATPAPTPSPTFAPPNPIAETFQAETRARVEAATAAKVGYVERLVAFWSNHFCVAANKSGQVRILCGAFEREAIRPYVLGRFADMARAVESHPAMLMFLDQAQSVGPNSRAGQNGKRGLNENLAREIMELHTLGVDGGYSQTDVTEFARMLTGWTVAGKEGKLGTPGTFVFNANAHEPGPRMLLGREYGEPGVAQGQAALDDLARHPATARHIARKFARAFVADTPSPNLVKRLTDVLVSTEGDLGALAHALIADDEAWAAPPAKLRDPWQMTMASYRALGLDATKPGPVNHALNQLGQPLWTPGGPNGFPDASDAWLSAEGIKMRVEIATGFARQAKDAPPPPELFARVLPDASSDTRDAVLRCETPQQAYAMLLLAPEFQRR